jgi:hypothetical protein
MVYSLSVAKEAQMSRKTKNKTMIVKVQIFTNDKSILIYDQTRKYNGVIKDNNTIASITERMEGKMKSYFIAEYTQNPVCFELLDIVEDKDW